MLSVEEGGIKYIFWVFGMIQAWMEHRSSEAIGEPARLMNR